jgi:hypothetical protein
MERLSREQRAESRQKDGMEEATSVLCPLERDHAGGLVVAMAGSAVSANHCASCAGSWVKLTYLATPQNSASNSQG